MNRALVCRSGKHVEVGITSVTSYACIQFGASAYDASMHAFPFFKKIGRYMALSSFTLVPFHTITHFVLVQNTFLSLQISGTKDRTFSTRGMHTEETCAS